MLVYTANKATFIQHVDRNEIDERILQAFIEKHGRSVARSEIVSWRQSMQYMRNILQDESIPSDAGVAIEYTIPQTSKRVDFILTGLGTDRRETAIIIELKQWEEAKQTSKDAVVETFINGQLREVLHPSYQAWSYAALLQDFNETVQKEDIRLRPCAYLHNCVSDAAINDPSYSEHTTKAPVFLKKDFERLQRFIKKHIRYGDAVGIMYRIENGKIKPSKALADHLASLLRGNREFVMIDDQKLVYEQALGLAIQAQNGQKNVLIVEGGPGTGKSVVAINLLVELTRREAVTQYVTRNSAPRQVFQSLLTGTMKKTRVANLFKGSGSYVDTEENTFDALIVDEAHRLNEKSGMFQNLGENQVMEIIRASRLSIFFVDEDQRVTLKDIGTRGEIERWAKNLGATVHYAELRSQFRCNGSDGYLAWLDNTLQVRDTANETLEGIDYHFEVVSTPTELRDKILELNRERNRARLVAGYCWDWISKKDRNAHDIRFDRYGFAMQWNLDQDGMLWILQPNSVQQVGCIHTCQGLELDYVGVIIGPDLVVRNGKVLTSPEARSRMDSTMRGYKRLRREKGPDAVALADLVIKNTYRTLMTRGTKGCLIWSVDEETNEYLRQRIGTQRKATYPRVTASNEPEAEAARPFRILPGEEVEPYANCVPVLDLKVAAGAFSDEQQLEVNDVQWAELPDAFRPRPGLFVAQVVGESMNRRIPNGAWCLFSRSTGGTRQGKVVLAQHREISDTDTGAHFTVKVYESEGVTNSVC